MISLYIVRHGETKHNLEGRIQGHSDSPLTALGEKQAKAIGRRLARVDFDAIYSSDLGRAVATAKAIASHHSYLPIRTTELLREANLGIVQGYTRDEFAAKYPEEFNKWREDSAKNRPPGAESLDSVIERCGVFLQKIVSEYNDGDRILAVVHGGSLRGLVCAAFGLSAAFYRSIYTANASLSIIDVGDRPAIRLLNDTCHLDSLKATEEDADNLPIYR